MKPTDGNKQATIFQPPPPPQDLDDLEVAVLSGDIKCGGLTLKIHNLVHYDGLSYKVIRFDCGSLIEKDLHGREMTFLGGYIQSRTPRLKGQKITKIEAWCCLGQVTSFDASVDVLELRSR